ncbi:MAG: hypothetical protein R3D58_18350 [Saprospiraceae bacterium]
MDQHLLKIRLREALEGRRVLAAVFSTFNFEPVFFENYVLPILTPEPGRFQDSAIANQLVWREQMRRGLMPEVTVYCDFHAKNNAEAPALGYEVRCLRLPEAGNAICNFHPKHIFLLLEPDTLLLVTGSGNLTPAGWCQNVEVFHIQKIERPFGQRPFTQRTNFLQRQFESLSALLQLPLSKAEQQINGQVLRYFSDDTLTRAIQSEYFTSVEESFPDFLQRTVFQGNKIERAEIISPYFSNGTECLDFLRRNGVSECRFLLPISAQGDEVLMLEDTFKVHDNKGASWHSWVDGALRNRFSHAKIYRFYAEKQVYTVIGSVNFTNPAWGKFIPAKHNRANIETAVLLRENARNATTLLSEQAVATGSMRFVSKNDLENPWAFPEERARRDAPDIKFKLDWEAKTLNVEFLGARRRSALVFKNILPDQALRRNETFQLQPAELRRLAKSSLIEILETTHTGSAYTHFYYPEQVNFEQRPLSLRLTTSMILQFWDNLSNESYMYTNSLRLSEATDEDTGEVGENVFEQPSLLNEWAQNFNGLVKLERFLFDPKRRVREREEQDRQIEWYLLNRSLETLPTYLDELKTQYEEGKIYHTFYWTVLQIIAQNFYEVAAVRFGKEKGKAYRRIAKQLENMAAECLKHIRDVEPAKWNWLREKIGKSI